METTDSGRMAEDIGKIIITSGEDILTPEKAGEMFGISKWAMYKRAKNGQAPSHRIGKKMYFFRSELVNSVFNSEP